MIDNNKRGQLYDNLIGTGRVNQEQIGTKDEFLSAIGDRVKASEFHKNLLTVFDKEEVGDELSFLASIEEDFMPNDPVNKFMAKQPQGVVGAMKTKMGEPRMKDGLPVQESIPLEVDEPDQTDYPTPQSLPEIDNQIEQLSQEDKGFINIYRDVKKKKEGDYQEMAALGREGKSMNLFNVITKPKLSKEEEAFYTENRERGDQMLDREKALYLQKDFLRLKENLEKYDSKDSGLKTFWKGLTQTGLLKDFLSLGQVELQRNLDVMGVFNKAVEEPEKLTKEEERLLTLYKEWDNASKQKTDFWYTAGQSSQIMGEFIANMVGANIAAGGLRAGMRSAFNVATKEFLKGAGKKVIAANIGKKLGEAAIFNVMALPSRTTFYKEFTGKSLEGYGKNQYGEYENTGSIGKDLYESSIRTFMEYFAEEYSTSVSGGYATNLLKSKAGNKLLGNTFEKLSKITDNPAFNQVTKVMNYANIGNVPEEMFEEVLTQAGNGLFLWSKDDIAQLADPDFYKSIAVSVIALQGAITGTQLVAGGVGNKIEKNRINRQATRSINELNTLNVTDESLINQISLLSEDLQKGEFADTEGRIELGPILTKLEDIRNNPQVTSEVLAASTKAVMDNARKYGTYTGIEAMAVESIGEFSHKRTGNVIIAKRGEETFYILDELPQEEGRAIMVARPLEGGESVSINSIEFDDFQVVPKQEFLESWLQGREIIEPAIAEQEQEEAIVQESLQENPVIEPQIGNGYLLAGEPVSVIDISDEGIGVQDREGGMHIVDISELTEIPQLAKQVAEQQVQVQEQPQVPIDEKGVIDYSQITSPELYAQALNDEFGEESITMIDELIAEQQDLLKKAEKGSTIERKRSERIINAEIEKLNQVRGILVPQEAEAPIEKVPINIESEVVEDLPEVEQKPVQEELPEITKKPLSETERRNKLVDDVRAYNKLSSAKKKKFNQVGLLRTTNELGFVFGYDKGGNITIKTKEGKTVTKVADKQSKEQTESHKGLSDYSDEMQQVMLLFLNNPESLVGLSGIGKAQTEQGIKNILAAKKTVAANALLDQLESDIQFGWVTVNDYKTGQKADVEIGEYLLLFVSEIEAINEDATELNDLPDFEAMDALEDMPEDIFGVYEDMPDFEEEIINTQNNEQAREITENQDESQADVPIQMQGEGDIARGEQPDTGIEAGDEARVPQQTRQITPQSIEIEKLQKDREAAIAEKNRLIKNNVDRVGLFGDTKIDPNDLFEGAGFDPTASQPLIDKQTEVIKEIDRKIEVLKKNEAAGIEEAKGQQSIEDKLAEEEAKVNLNPSEGQKEAGNYKKGHITIQGFDLTIENPKGSQRSGVDESGREWSQILNNTYGYILGTTGKDGGHIDVFLGDNLESDRVFVVDQINKDKSFDEHKVMLGFDTIIEAEQAYLSNYEEGWQGLGNITQVPIEDFRKWTESGTRKIKPFAEYKQVKDQPKAEEVQPEQGEVEDAPERSVSSNRVKAVETEEGEIAIVDNSIQPDIDNKAGEIGEEMSEADIKEGEETLSKMQDFGQKIGMARKDTAERGFTLKRGKGEKEAPGWSKKYKIFKQEKGTSYSDWNTIEGKYSVNIVSGNFFKTLQKNFNTEEEAMAAIPMIEVSRNHRVYQSKKEDEYSIYRKWSSGKLWEIKKGFKSREEALMYMAKNAEEIIGYKVGRVERPHLDKIEREGVERRKGNVTPEQFMETFGFRGGEFGNWVAADERQSMLNFAFDALLDMADIIGVSPRALSLGGRLAIGFGSRGQGLSGAAAHFEPERGVINLTKISGAGSLAHEWFHAFDSYFGVVGRKGFIPNQEGVMPEPSRERDYLSGDYNSNPYVRKEVKDAWRQVWETMRYKKELSEYDMTRLQRQYDSAINSLNSSLKTARAWMERDRTYGLRKKAATPEQLAKWDSLAEKANKFEFGKVQPKKTKKKYSFENEYQLQRELQDLYKEVTGRESGQLEYGEFRNIELNRELIQKAEKDKTFEARKNTTFYNGSKDMDASRVSSYWGTNLEMAARAFEAYVDDRIKEAGARNDYLVHSVNNYIYEVLYDAKPYPEGEERQNINKAFDNLFKVLEEKIDEEGNTLLYRTSDNTDLTDFKRAQFNIIQATNPMLDDYHTGIRSVEDIYTFEEAYRKDIDTDNFMLSPDYKQKDVEDALESGSITIYSSKPIQNGVFVTPSKMEAEAYSANGKTYSKIVALSDVAWINNYEGQYAKQDTNLYRTIGERGVSNQSEEAIIRLDNLKVAREMETQNKSQKQIKLATGWERGKDTKWRYEVEDDITIKKIPTLEFPPKFHKFDEIFESKTLFKQYPQIKDIKVVFIDKPNGGFGSFTPIADILELNINEGLLQRLLRGLRRSTTRVETSENRGNDQSRNDYADVLGQSLVHEVQHIIQMYEGFTQGSRTEDIQALYPELVVERLKANESMGEPTDDEGVFGSSGTRAARDIYYKTAGEVEARNVARRLDMPLQERLSTLLSETEDVSREDQIILGEQLSSGLLLRTPYFYSPTEQALNSIKQEKATPEQWRAMLLKNGAKQAEMDWMGFDEFSQDRKSLTKADIQEWIDQNKIEIEEVEKRQESGSITNELTDNAKEELERLQEIEQRWLSIESAQVNGYELTKKDQERLTEYENEFEDISEVSDKINDLQNDANNYKLDENGDTKYSQYQLPGGTNYKELLLTMPSKLEKEKRRQENANEFINIEEGKYQDDFHSGHWDEPNILAHIRFNEREVNGERILFLEEIQSDWAQKGKKDGFVNDRDKSIYNFAKSIYNIKIAALRKQISQEEAERKLLSEKVLSESQGITEQEINQFLYKYGDFTMPYAAAVPDMPFKNTDQWVNLALRRMMIFAAENGFDRIAWTTGDIQAERYDLSKQAKRIQFFKQKDGTYRGIAYDKDDDVAMNFNGDANKLETIIGKEATQKIVEKAEETGRQYYLNNQDLKVGGQGMKAFYDQILPAQANKIGKKFNAKVESVEIPASEVAFNENKELDPADFTPKAQEYTSRYEESIEENGDYSAEDYIDDMAKEGFIVEMDFNSGEPISVMKASKGNTTPVQSIPITQGIREQAQIGMPLFSILGEKGAKALDIANNSEVILNNLAIAKQFTKDGKDAKTIRLATGWEMGNDKKWRYEIPDDIKIKQLPIVEGNIPKFTTFGEIIESKSLLTAYPELKDVQVIVENVPSKNSFGSYTELTNTLSINASKEVYRLWLQGLNLGTTRNGGATTTTTNKGGIDYETFLGQSVVHEIQHIIQSYEGFTRGSSTEYILSSYPEPILQGDVDSGGLANAEERKAARRASATEIYKKLSGEVEARNAVERMNYSVEERRQTLLSETEDVAREDQILLESAILGTANSEIQNTSVFNLAEEANRLASNLGVKVTIKLDASDMPPMRIALRKTKGWFDPKTKEIVIILSNHDSLKDIQETIFHEAVGHMGLRGLLGAKFNPVMNQVFESMPRDARATFLAKYGNKALAAEEYLATLAEQDINPTLLQKIISIVRDAFRAIGIDLRFNDSDMLFMLWRSKNRLKRNPTIVDTIKDFNRVKEVKERLREGVIPETISIIGVQKPTRNSEGKYIHPTEEGIRNFYKWFGDSKVVDNEGRPLVVYHGTNSEFNEFKNKKDVGLYGSGYYFTQYKETANQYGNIKEYYLASEKPIIITPQKTPSILYKLINASGKYDYGYTGVIVKDNQKGLESITVFSPSQIKSINNQGTFDGDNNDIRFRESSGLGLINNTDWQDQVWEQNKDLIEVENLGIFQRNQETENIPENYSSQHFTYEPGLRDIYANPKAYNEVDALYKKQGYLDEGYVENYYNPEDFQLKAGYVAAIQASETGNPKQVGGSADDTYAITFIGEKIADVYDGEIVRPIRQLEVWQKQGSSYTKLLDNSLRFRDDDNAILDTNDIQLTASQKFIQAMQDRMMSGRILIDEIQKRGGKVGQMSNFVTEETRSSSRGKYEIDNFLDNYFKPLTNKVKDLMNKGGVSQFDIEDYMKAKHAPEVNKRLTSAEVYKSVLTNYQSEITKLKNAKADLTTEPEIKAMNEAIETAIRLSNFYQAKENRELVDGLLSNAYDNKFNGEELNPIEVGGAEFNLAKDIQKRFVSRMKKVEKSEDGNIRSGKGDAEAKAIVEGFEGRFEPEDITDLWDKIRAATRFSLDISFKYGLISKETYEASKSMYEYYVPLRGWEVTEQVDYSNIFGKEYMGHEILNPVNKQAKGRQSEADAPLGYIGSMAETAIIAGNKNEVRKQAWRLVMNNAEMTDLFLIKDAWEVNIGTPEEPSWEQQYEVPTQELLETGMARKLPLNNKYTWHKTKAQLNMHQVPVMIDGKRVVIEFKGNLGAEVAGAINGDKVLRWRGTDKIGNITRVMAALKTSKNPDFMLTNFTRDFFFGNMAYYIRGGNPIALTSNLGRAWKAIHLDISGKENKDPYMREMRESFKQEGAQTGYAHMLGQPDFKKKAEKLIKEANDAQGSPSVYARKSFEAMNHGLDYLAVMSEDAMRFAIFITEIERLMKEAGVDTPTASMKKQAALAAKELTTNFNKKGNFSSQIGTFYAFFNASVQGTTNYIKLAKENPARFIKANLFILSLRVALHALCSMLDGDDDDYEALSDFVKENNLVIPITNGEYITIPLPHGARALTSIGNYAVDVINGTREADEAMSDYIKNLISESSPINLVGMDKSKFIMPQNIKEGILTALPTALRPITEAGLGVDFMGNPIERKNFVITLEGKVPRFQNAYPSTNKLLVGGTKFLNKVWGGTDYRSSGKQIEDGMVVDSWKGIFDISPALTEHIIEGYLGGLGRFFNDTYKTARSLVQGEVPAKQNIPVVRRLYQEPYQSMPWERYYETRQRVDEINFYKTQAKKNGDEKSFSDLNSLYNNTISDTFDKYSKVITLFSKEMKTLDKKSPEYKERKTAIDALVNKLDVEIKNIDKRFNKK